MKSYIKNKPNKPIIVWLAAAAWCLASGVKADGWEIKAPMPSAESGAAVASINDVIYVAGGQNKNGPLSTLQVYDPVTNSWGGMAPLPEPRYDGNGAGVIYNKLYLAGGWTVSSTVPRDTLFVYDSQTNAWSQKANMPHLSACGATGQIDGKLYVTTACDGNAGFRNWLDVYDPQTDSWTPLSPSAGAHAEPGAGVIHGKLYVAGGQDANAKIIRALEVYDPVTDKWVSKAPMPLGVVSPGSMVLNGMLYIMGGKTASGALTNQVQRYIPAKNVWERWSYNTGLKMPTARYKLGVGVAYGVGFALGGTRPTATLGRNEALFKCPEIP